MTTTYEQDRETLGSRVADTLEITPETYPLVFGIVSRALGIDPLPAGIIPPDATFTVRRDVEYLAEDITAREHGDDCPYPESENWEDCECETPYDCHPNYAAPRGDSWERSGDDEPIESDWSGSDQFVRAYRWDRYAVTVPELEDLARENQWDVDNGDVEPLGGYLDAFGMHPAVSIMSDGMDWNMGGWTPVFIAADYVVLD